MRFTIYFLILIGLPFSVQAKKVKFAVNMNEQTVSPNGVHCSGDFQTLAGFSGGNWNSATTTLTQEGTSGIYSIVVTLPAFRKYEYKFVNGDQFYEVEFVPEISRVGHDFNDNRWIYVDSLSPDTFFVGAIRFGENTPSGLKMIRFLSDLNPVATVGKVHVAGSFNSFDYQKTIMYSFVDKLQEVIQFVNGGNYEYIFANGNTAAAAENVPAGCANANGKRTVQVLSDTVLEAFCFGSCTACLTSVSGKVSKSDLGEIFPNPSGSEPAIIHLSGTFKNIEIFDSKGAIIEIVRNHPGPEYKMGSLKSGLYFVRISDQNQSQSIRFISR